MASVQKTSSSTWQVRYKDPETRKHRAKTFKRKVDAQRFLHSVEHSINSGTYIGADRAMVRVGDWVRQHVEERADLAPSTRVRTYSIITQHIVPKWAQVTLKDIRHRDVQQWVRELSDADLSARTTRKVVGVLSSALDAAVRDRRMVVNPCHGVTYPRPDLRRPVYLTPAQVEQMTSIVDGRERIIVLVLAYCGLRWGELAGLRVKDVDVARRRLSVEQTIISVNSKLFTKPPKDHERRSVPVPSFLMEQIEQWMSGKEPGSLLLTSPQGAALRNRNERRGWFNSAADAIGVPELTPHGMRHTAASMAIAAGASVLAVQRMLGHSSATVTLDVYADLFEDDLDALADRLDTMRAEYALRGSYA